MYDTVGQRFTQYLLSEKMTSKRLSEISGVSEAVISKLKRDKTNIQSDMLEKIIYVLPNLNVRWLLTGKGTMYNEIENKVEGIVSDAGVGYVRTLKKTENSTSTMELLQQLKSENELLRDQVRAWQSGLITRNVIS